MTQPIHIALASDENYFEGLLTTVWSIVRNCSRPEDLHFHILDGGIPDVKWLQLVERITPYGAHPSRLSTNQESAFAGFAAYHGSGKMTYARLLLPDLLPDVDQIIYTDVDVLWLADIAELWDSLDPSAVVHIVPLPGKAAPHEQRWYDDHGFVTKDDPPFCAGVMVLSLSKFRDEKLHLNMLATIRNSNEPLPAVDQTAINAHLFGRRDKVHLSRRWQRGSGGYTDLEPEGFVLHYLVDAPWKSVSHTHHMITDQHMLWHRYHQEASGCTIWQSLRIGNSATAIIFGRILYKAATNSRIVRALLHLAMTIKGLRANIPCLDYYLRKFNLPDGPFNSFPKARS